MPKDAVLGRRHVLRIAEGVRRGRLVDPILAGHPSLVTISAPSGYGKSVLAAQISSSPAFSQVIWIDAMGDRGSAREALVALASATGAVSSLAGISDTAELASVCAAGMAGIADDCRTVVVFDDVDWRHDLGMVGLLTDIAAEAPVGSSVIVTSRTEFGSRDELLGVWRLGPADLLLSDSEIADMCQAVGGPGPEANVLESIRQASGRHAALASLLIRQLAITEFDDVSAVGAGTVRSAIQCLSEQLTECQSLMLRVASVLGAGDAEMLDRCLLTSSSHASLEAIAAALPLVRLEGGGPSMRFVVHDLVEEALDAVRHLANQDPTVLGRVLQELQQTGSGLRAVTVARRAGRGELLASALSALEDASIVEAHAGTIRSALSEIPPTEMAGSPSLLLLSAQLHWQDFDATDAIREARLAAQIAGFGEDERALTRACVLLLRMRTAAGDLAGTAAEVWELLSTARASLGPEDMALVAFSGIMAFGLMGDRDGLAECLEIERSLRRSPHVSPLTQHRLGIARGVISALFDGAWPESVASFTRAAALPVYLERMASAASHNMSVSLLEMGRVSEALLAAGTIGESGDHATDGVGSLARVLQAAASILVGEDAPLRETADGAVEEAVAEGDWLSAATASQFASALAVYAGDIGSARSFSERAVSASIKTGSPVLLWTSELLEALSTLAIGDAERAGAVVDRVMPLAEAAKANTAVLHAKMLSAELALRREDLACCVEHLTWVSEHVLVHSPLVTVAAYVRAFPDLLGPLVLSMGVGRMPDRLAALLGGQRGRPAIEQAARVLSPRELQQLTQRIESQDKTALTAIDDAEPDGTCHVRLFGGLQVVTPRGQVGERDWSKRKARLLFAMLVSRMGTDVPRGEIIEYLWPDMQEERALNNFYVVWSAMKRAICPESVRDSPCPYVEHVRGVCRIVKQRVVSDLEEFAGLLSTARTARRDGDVDKELTALRALSDIYTGEVLPGDVYDDWFAPLRDRFRHDFEDAMLRASSILEQQGDPHGGLQLLRRAMAADPWREDLYQAQLRMQIAAGQRSAAIETYMLCRSRLTADLGIDPSRETTALYEQVLGMEEPDGMSRV